MPISLEFATRLRADSALMALLEGGVYTPEELETSEEPNATGDDRITRGNAPEAFSEFGFLKPCALVVQQATVPSGNIEDDDLQWLSVVQRVEIWFYQDRGYTVIDAALERARQLLQGYQFTNTYPVSLAYVTDRLHDQGSLDGASTVRQDWQVHFVLGLGED